CKFQKHTSLSPSVCRAFLGCQIEKAVDELNLTKKNMWFAKTKDVSGLGCRPLFARVRAGNSRPGHSRVRRQQRFGRPEWDWRAGIRLGLQHTLHREGDSRPAVT